MTLLYCGINLFGQFDAAAPAAAIKNFKTAQIKGIALQHNFKVSSTWCYAAYAAENRLILQGFLGEKHPAHGVRHEVEAEANIKDICSCDNFCLVLLENGKLYKILPKLNSILEEIKLDRLIEADEVTLLPHKRTIFGEIIAKNEDDNKYSKITHIACGTNITAAIDEENRLFSIPSEIHRFPKGFKVKQLVCGFEHALLLSANGDIYVWGIGLRGQLGREDLAEEEAPILLEALAGIKITHIAAGGWHCAAISAFGDLYVWGFNSDGQLCLGPMLTSESKTFFLPQIATMPACSCAKITHKECFPVKVFSGARHLVLVMECGKIYSAGCNKNGQLGQPNKSIEKYVDFFTPMTLDGFEEKEDGDNLNIYCGHWNTILQKDNKILN